MSDHCWHTVCPKVLSFFHRLSRYINTFWTLTVNTYPGPELKRYIPCQLFSRDCGSGSCFFSEERDPVHHRPNPKL